MLHFLCKAVFYDCFSSFSLPYFHGLDACFIIITIAQKSTKPEIEFPANRAIILTFSPLSAVFYVAAPTAAERPSSPDRRANLESGQTRSLAAGQISRGC